MKTLISWLAYNNDFTKDGSVETENSPNYNMHKNFWEYDRHILLSSAEKEDLRLEKIENRLSLDFPDHKVEKKYMRIADVIDLNEIKTKVETMLHEFIEDDITIFFSPGTSAMQVTWYICHTTLNLNTRLIQMRPASKSRTHKNELLEIETEISTIPVTSILKEKYIEIRDSGNKSKKDYLISKSINPVYGKAEKISQTDKVTVLINGETGTGKEHLAKFIHDKSIRNGYPFITVNCSAFNDELLIAELFGYKKGAYTGAEKDTIGLFEQANNGTIFLDEIADISPKLQQTLLRVLQQKEIQPLQMKPKKIDVRVIAATNKNLSLLCKEGKFRWDLYYRLAIAELEIPSLQARGIKEIDEMIEFFIDQKMHELKKAMHLKFAPGVKEFLQNYPWPGNVRELENLIETLYVFCDEIVEMKDLPARFKETPKGKSLRWVDIEKEHIEYVLTLKKGNQRQAWLALDYGSINTLRNKIRQYNIAITEE